ncbi:MAG: ATP-binding protein, partial [Rhodocyclaceae bacterium]|nr:ATP-binding protein [Rhodocyclaceae bacterium]
MLNRIKIVTRLAIGFSLMLLGALVVGVWGTRSITHLSEISSDILQHPFAVTTAVLNVRSDVLAIQKMANDVVSKASPAEADLVQQKLAATTARIDNNLKTLHQRFRGSPAEITHIDKALADWHVARDETLVLARNGRRAEAAVLHDGRDARLVDVVFKEVSDVVDLSAAKAAELEQAALQERDAALGTIALLLVVILCGGAAGAFLITRSVRQSLQLAVTAVHGLIADSTDKVLAAQAVGDGDLSREVVVSAPLKIDLDSLPQDEIGVLMKTASHLSEVQCALDEAFLEMTKSLRSAREKESARDWLKSGRNELNFLIQEEQSTTEIADTVLGFLVTHLGAGLGALYLFDERAVKLNLTATFAASKDMKLGEHFRLGEGVIGQAAREQKIIFLNDVPADYMPIGSALGKAVPKIVVAIPLLHGNRLVGVIEIGTFREFTDTEVKFLELAKEGIAIAIDASIAHHQTAELLEQTEQQAEELRVQQEELQQSNEELEERAQLLEQQRENIRLKNQDIETASQILQEKVAELEQVSTYKSEFLANMSHELRTPLNSLMILSSLLKQNKDGNLSDKQIEFAATIHSAGTDLLNLINDILDLSKIEAGQMQFNFVAIPVPDLCAAVRALFNPLAEQKGLVFRVETAANVPATFDGDEQRVHQILKNLLSNALKFTEQGEVSLRIAMPVEQESPLPVPTLAFIVSDTGIGIPAAKQQLVFDAFQQADGSISRKYGGTGLGLSISLQLARHMHGEIRMSSEAGKGSVFTLYMPLAAAHGLAEKAATSGVPAAPLRPLLQPSPPLVVAPPPPREERRESSFSAAPLSDAGARLPAPEKSILIIEDDLNF